MVTEIEKIERKTVRYWFIDGIWEMAWSGFILMWGLLFLAQALVPPAKSSWQFLLLFGFLPLFILAGWAVNRTVRTLKQKLTYPRTGYLSYRRPEGKQRVRRSVLAGGLAGAIGALIAYLLLRLPANLAWMPLLTGLAFAPVFVFLAVRAGAVRLYAVAGVSAAAGVVLSRSGWSDLMALAAYYGIIAVSLFISGFITCRRYLRRNPLPDEASR